MLQVSLSSSSLWSASLPLVDASLSSPLLLLLLLLLLQDDDISPDMSIVVD
jgi:hypothetical protein